MTRFWKVQSIGNDFPLVLLDEAPADLSALAIRLADRKFGIGGDGLLAMGREESALRLRMFNPDGTEDFCGNGIRSAARLAYDLGWFGFRFEVRHLDRTVPVEIEGERVTTTLGPATYEPAKVPARRAIMDGTIWEGMDGDLPLHFFGSALTTGSTHAVLPVYSLPDDESFRWVSSRIETAPDFPDRTSVIWVREVEPMRLRIRIWERGVGETLGCGTGSSAAAADYMRRKGKGGRVIVENPGGTLEIEAGSWHAPLRVAGTAQTVYEGTFA